jgi:hypothetical protein
MLGTDALVRKIDALVDAKYAKHPFADGITEENFALLIANYLGMSLAFPYLQAGAQYRLIAECIYKDRDVTREIEITSVVGAFLTWDEVGGHAVVKEHGNSGLPRILDTQGFHANLLRSDIKTILGREVRPMFGEDTKDYLKRLEYGLSATDTVTRVAYMVAFEKHAGAMISTLWDAIAALFSVSKEALSYFRIHVGGNDPAEEYHIQMTRRMISETIAEHDEQRFVDFFEDAYILNHKWCEAIKGLGGEESA